jgi:cytochrome c oxidase subunit II
VERFFGMPDALTHGASDIDGLFGLVFWITLAVFVLVEVLLVVFLLRFKRKAPGKEGKNIHGNTKAEVIWTLIPAIILVVLGIYSSGMVYAIQQPPADVYEIKVTGMKWAWQFEYPNGAVSNGDLRLPEGKNVLFKITSKDVIHSFWIPEFRMKQDAVPGRETRYWVKAADVAKVDQKYTKHVICAEYCGNAHSKMLADFTIMNDADFDKWVAEEKVRKKTDGPSVALANGCTSCHSTDGSKGAGPTWKGTWGTDRTLVNGQKVKVDENYIKESITTPGAKVAEGFQNMMPAFQLDDDQVKGLVEYFKELK